MNINFIEITALFTVMIFSNFAMADQETYRIDNIHSFANWTIRHEASKTLGTFNDVACKLLIDSKNLANSQITAKINVLSINSSHLKCDEHIKKQNI